LLFSNVNDVPKCDLAIQYALYSISDNDFKYISFSCSLDNVCEDVSMDTDDGEDIVWINLISSDINNHNGSSSLFNFLGFCMFEMYFIFSDNSELPNVPNLNNKIEIVFECVGV
jgi:hypothetical protein